MSGSVSFDLNYMDLLSGDFFNENIIKMVVKTKDLVYA